MEQDIQQSKKRCYVPHVVDLIEDNMRSRVLFPLAALLLYILIVVSIANIEDEFDEPPQEIKAALPFKDSYDLNMNFNSTFPSPRVKVSNKLVTDTYHRQGPMPNIEVTVRGSDLLIQNDASKPNCDSISRRSVAGTLEYLRMEDVCKINITGYRSITSREGFATFDNFSLGSGPQGTYSFVFTSPLSKSISQEYQMFLRSNASYIIVDNTTTPPYTQKVGQPFKTQPIVYVFDESGNPLRGARVVAFSWPEPKFSGQQLPYLSDPNRFAWLEGNVVFTDQDGTARFQTLTIQGANSVYVYIFFAVNGVLVANWGIEQPYYASVYDTSVYYNGPITLVSPVAEISINLTAPVTVREMQSFEKPIQATVKDINGDPVANQIVFASIVGAGPDDLYPMAYPPYIKGQPNKLLVFPIPGVYSSDYSNPLSLNDVMYPLVTDSKGQVTFDALQFSSDGNAGQYQIRFSCIKANINAPMITVTSAVNDVQFITEPISYINIAETQISDALTPVLQILDVNGKGVSGKSPQISVVQLDKDTGKYVTVAQGDLDLRLNTASDAYEPSNSDGYVKLVFRLQFMRAPSITFQLAANVDSVVVYSRSITLQQSEIYQKTCGTVLFSGDASKTQQLQVGDTLPLQFSVYDNSGDVMVNQEVFLVMNYVSTSVTQFPSDFYPSSLGSSVKTDPNGVASFRVEMMKGATGTVQLQAVTYTPLSQTFNAAAFNNLVTQISASPDTVDSTQQFIFQSEQNLQIQMCYSPYIPVAISSDVEFLIVTDLKLVKQGVVQTDRVPTDGENPILYTYDNTNQYQYDVTVQVFKDSLGTQYYANLQLTIEVSFLTKPPYQMGFSSDANLKTVETLIIPKTPFTTDAQGNAVVRCQVSTGMIGQYVITFFSQGSYSQGLMFQVQDSKYPDFTKFKFDTVTSLQQKTNNNAVGTFMVSGTTKLTYDGQPAVGAIVVAAIQRMTQDGSKPQTLEQQFEPDSYLDITDLGNLADPMAVIATDLRIGQISGGYTTDSSGQVTFSKLSVTDVQPPQACVHFKLYIGSSDSPFLQNKWASGDLGIESNPGTWVFCFTQNKVVEISSTSYSTTITQGSRFPQPIKIKVTKKQSSDYDQQGLIVYSAIPVSIKNFAPPYPYGQANLYLSNFLCAYMAQSALPVSKSVCTPKVSITGKGPYMFEIEFTGLTWLTSASTTRFQLAFTDPLNDPTPIISSSGGDPQFEPIPEAAVTQSIQVTSVPSTIQITAQPPDTVTVNEAFPVGVIVKISSGLPVQRATVTAFVTPDPTQAKIQPLSQLRDLVFTLASGQADARSIGALTKKQNILLDPNTATKKTNKKGMVMFNLKILSGVPGKYTITFQSGNVQSQRSISFELLNKIISANVTSQVEQNVHSPIVKDVEPDYVTFSEQPKLKLKFANDLPFLGQKRIDVRVYKWVDPVELQAAVNQTKNSTMQTMEIMMDSYQNQGAQLQATAGAAMSNTWNAIVNGGKIVKAVSQSYENFQVQFSYPQESLDGSLTFTDLSVQYRTFGTFMLVFVINGVESAASAQFTVSAPPPTVKEYILSVFEIIVILSVVVAVLLGITAKNHYVWMIFGLAVAITACGLIYMSTHTLTWKVLVWTTLAIMICSLIYSIIMAILQTCCKKDVLFSYEHKYNFYNEYTYQSVNGYPSQEWLAHINNDRRYVPHYKLKPQAIALRQEDAVANEDVYATRLVERDLSTMKFFGRMFIPFVSSQRTPVIGNCFYFPQRLLGASLLSFVSVVYIAYQAFLFTGRIEGWIDSVNAQIRSANFFFMYASLNSMVSVFSDSPFPEDTYQRSQNAINFITDQLNLLSEALTIAFYIATSISCLIFLFAFFVLLYDFKKRVLMLRRGQYDFIWQRVGFPLSTSYIGIQIANSSISFLIVLFLFAMVFTILCHPLFWQLIWENITLILGLLLSSSLLMTVAQMIALKFIIDPVQGIKYRRLWSLFELFMLYLAIVGGLLSAISRIILLFVLSMVGLARLDQSLFPEWINDIIYLDSANKTYLSMVYLYHSHNHPIAVTCLNLLKRDRDVIDTAVKPTAVVDESFDKPAKPEADPQKPARQASARGKLQLLGLLLQNEDLQKIRSEQRKKLKEIEEAKKKKDEPKEVKEILVVNHELEDAVPVDADVVDVKNFQSVQKIEPEQQVVEIKDEPQKQEEQKIGEQQQFQGNDAQKPRKTEIVSKDYDLQL